MSPLLPRLVLAALGAAAGPPVFAQPDPADQRGPQLTVKGGGSELFRGLFRHHRIEPVSPDDIGEDDYAKLIVVVHGTPNPNDPQVAAHVQKTLRAGGSVLITAEQPTSFPGYFQGSSGIEITAQPITTENPDRRFQNNPNCPFVESRQPSITDIAIGGVGPRDAEWTLFPLYPRIATNMPRSIRVTGARPRHVWNTLAAFPVPSSEGEAPLPRVRPFAVGGSGDEERPFRCLILADTSVFSNQMIAAQGTDNLLFANGVVQWLTADGERTRCLFLEAGRVQEEFPDLLRAVPVTPPLPPLPPLPSPLDPELQQRLTAAGETALANVDEQNPFDRLFGGGGRNNRLFNRTLLTFAVVAAVLVTFWLVRRWWAGTHEPDLAPLPKDTGRVAASGPPGSLARRREEILQAGNYTDLVREYLREMFVARGLTLPPPRTMPAVEVSGRDAGAIRSHLRILWEVAFAAKPKPISYSRWKELEPMLDAVRHAADEGRWRFAPGGRA